MLFAKNKHCGYNEYNTTEAVYEFQNVQVAEFQNPHFQTYCI